METEKKAYISLAIFAVLLVAIVLMAVFKANAVFIWIAMIVEFMVAIFGLFPHSFEGEEF